jgi:hypothetical protein
MTTIEKLRAKMRAAADPAKPIKRQDPVDSYHEAKARIAQKGGTSPTSPASSPARKFSKGVQDWESDPPMHLRERVESAREHSA